MRANDPILYLIRKRGMVMQTRLSQYLVKAARGDGTALMASIDTPFALLAAVHFAKEHGGEEFTKEYGTLARDEIVRLLEVI